MIDGQITADNYISSARGTIDAEHYDARIVSEEHNTAIHTFFSLLPGLRKKIEGTLSISDSQRLHTPAGSCRLF